MPKKSAFPKAKNPFDLLQKQLKKCDAEIKSTNNKIHQLDEKLIAAEKNYQAKKLAAEALERSVNVFEVEFKPPVQKKLSSDFANRAKKLIATISRYRTNTNASVNEAEKIKQPTQNSDEILKQKKSAQKAVEQAEAEVKAAQTKLEDAEAEQLAAINKNNAKLQRLKEKYPILNNPPKKVAKETRKLAKKTSPVEIDEPVEQNNVVEMPAVAPNEPVEQNNVAEMPAVASNESVEQNNVVVMPAIAPNEPVEQNNVVEMPAVAPNEPVGQNNVVVMPAVASNEPVDQHINVVATQEQSSEPVTQQNCVAEISQVSPSAEPVVQNPQTTATSKQMAIRKLREYIYTRRVEGGSISVITENSLILNPSKIQIQAELTKLDDTQLSKRVESGQAKSHYNSFFGSLCAFFGGYSEREKTKAAEKVVDLLEGKQVTFTLQDFAILYSDRLKNTMQAIEDALLPDFLDQKNAYLKKPSNVAENLKRIKLGK